MKRGSLFVEAAMYYPLMIAALICVIVLVTSMYSATCSLGSIHTGLTARQLELTDTGRCMNSGGAAGLLTSREYYKGKEVIMGKINRSYLNTGLFSVSLIREHHGQFYMINEREYIRKADLIKTA